MTNASDWQTRVGDVWAEEWRRTDRSFADLARHLDAAIAAVAPATGRAADLGSGAGATSLALARARPDLAIHGIDLSPALVAIAQARAAEAGIANAQFHIGAVPAALTGPYDLAVSRHGVMFFDDPAAAFTGIARHLAPGAPLLFTCFRRPVDNHWAVALSEALGGGLDVPEDYAPGPFAFADDAFVRDLLTATGFVDIVIQPIDFTYRAGEGPDAVDDALGYFQRIGPAARALALMSPTERPAGVARLHAMLAAHARGDAVDFAGAAWLVSARTAGH